MSHDQFIGDLQTLGIPVVLLLAIGWGAWQGAKWIAPRLDKFLTAQFLLIDHLKEAADRFGRTLEGISESLKELHKSVGEIREHVGIDKPKDE